MNEKLAHRKAATFQPRLIGSPQRFEWRGFQIELQLADYKDKPRTTKADPLAEPVNYVKWLPAVILESGERVELRPVKDKAYAAQKAYNFVDERLGVGVERVVEEHEFRGLVFKESYLRRRTAPQGIAA